MDQKLSVVEILIILLSDKPATFFHNLKASSSSEYTVTDNFSFEIISRDKFPCYWLARNVAKIGKNTGLILNAANEISVEYFLEGKISYLDIPNVIEDILETSKVVDHDSLETIVENDLEVRKLTKDLIKTKYL